MLILIYTIVTIHLGCVLASLYMHRYVIHGQYYLNPRVETVFKTLYWILFGVVSREFVVQHRKHHEFSDTPMDPHSPRFGFWKLLINCLVPNFFWWYQIKVSDKDYSRYSGSISNTVIDRYPRLGVVLLLLINMLLFGWVGILAWVIHLFVVNLLTITTITVFGHSVGYRNFNLSDLTCNIVPKGIVCVGEELHNNHHKDSRQCNFAISKREFDLGFYYLQILNRLNVVQFK
jgi:stearoyl-CoA desaturase (delta-9 desaturase)